MMENNPLFWRSDRNLFLAYNYGIKDWIHFESWMDFKLSLKSILSLFSLSPFPSPRLYFLPFIPLFVFQSTSLIIVSRQVIYKSAAW